MGIGIHWACPARKEYIDSNAVGDNEKYPVGEAMFGAYYLMRYGAWVGESVRLYWDTDDLPWETSDDWTDATSAAADLVASMDFHQIEVGPGIADIFIRVERAV